MKVQFQAFSAAPLNPVPDALAGFCHTLAIVLVDRAFLDGSDDALWNWLADCWRHVDQSKGKHGMLVVTMEEGQVREFSTKRPELATLQVRPAQQLGEFSVRPTMLALRALHEARRLLASGLPTVAGQQPGYMRIFISHAKIDGLPLAQALKHHIATIHWLRSFYDAEDLADGENWQRGLEEGVGTSIIVMLRTDVYDSRDWCQQEVRWADEYATPAVLVDARTSLTYPASALPFDRVPTVRIPDGNLLRVLFLALREGLRFLLFARYVEEMKDAGEIPKPHELRVFSITPSMPALLRACNSLADPAVSGVPNRYILYPDPPFRSGVLEAAEALVATAAPGVRLATPLTLAATENRAP
ncbi:MAG TPA: toll/interleukin-1 receptor domain-containing protein [Longimicrobium sp.]